jgi:hypothetical protein
MYILITILFLFLTTLALVILRAVRPNFRFAWLTAAGGAFLTWLSVILWQLFMPFTFNLPAWQPANLFKDTPIFFADQFSWPYALSLVSLVLAMILTVVVRNDFPDQLSWAATLTLTGLGMLAVLADNPLTLVLVWVAIDLTELVSQILSVDGEAASERVVTGFAARILGTGILLWAGMTSLSKGIPLDFHTIQPEVGMILIVAASLRLGVLPLHLSYTSETSLRRGYGTALRLVSAASSLILLAHIPVQSSLSPFAPFLLILVAVAGVYGGLLWIRSSDDLTGRPYWIIGMSALAIASALRGNPAGTVAWGVALILAGGALFLSSAQNKILSRALLIIGVWGLSSLSFSPTASGWQNETTATWTTWIIWPLLLTTQALLISGFIRHALRPTVFTSLESQPIWSRNVYPFGIGILLFTLTMLGLYGWDGALTIGSPIAGLVVAAFTGALYWLTPRLPWLNPIGVGSIQAEGQSSRLDSIYRLLWNIYRQAGRLSASFVSAFEGDGGILWALLFLVLFISILAPRLP